MQPMPPRPSPPYHVRVQKITAFTLLANILFLVAIAASGALAPYVGLHAVGGPRLVSLVLPRLPSFAGPLVSGLAADVSRSRPEAHPVVVASLDRVVHHPGHAPAARRPLSAEPSAPVVPSAPPTSTPGGGTISPVGGGDTTATPITPPAEETVTPDPQEPVAEVERPAKSHGKAYGVVKHAAEPKKGTKHVSTPKTGKPATTKKSAAPVTKKSTPKPKKPKTVDDKKADKH